MYRDKFLRSQVPNAVVVTGDDRLGQSFEKSVAIICTDAAQLRKRQPRGALLD